MGFRAAALAALLLACHAAEAVECGARLHAGRLVELRGELHGQLTGLAAYGESLADRLEANRVGHLLQELIVLQERIDRVAMLAEIRDAMRHDGEKSFVQFKLSHEASLLKLASSRAHRDVSEVLTGRAGIEQGVGRLLEAIARAQGLFAACDSPM